MRSHAEKVLACLLIALFAGTLQADSQRPNVVFFLVDDLGQRDVGCYGSSFYETPAIDQLAKEGVLFQNAYSTCHVCSPSRASILTGKYPARTNLTEWLGGRPERDYEKLHHGEKLTVLPDSEQTLAETLHKHGYATANYGKAHLNKDPMTYGFDEAITGWVRSYYHPFSPAYEKTLAAKKGDYYTDKLTDAAIDFIERNKERPFFLFLALNTPHAELLAPRDELWQKYMAKGWPENAFVEKTQGRAGDEADTETGTGAGTHTGTAQAQHKPPPLTRSPLTLTLTSTEGHTVPSHVVLLPCLNFTPSSHTSSRTERG